MKLMNEPALSEEHAQELNQTHSLRWSGECSQG